MLNLPARHKALPLRFPRSIPRSPGARISILGFAVLIAIGTLPLMLSEVSTNKNLGFVNALFTVTSANCVTGLLLVETAIEGMKLGAMDYLVKPCDTEALVTKINKVYQRKAEQEVRIREAKVKAIIWSPRSVLREE